MQVLTLLPPTIELVRAIIVKKENRLRMRKVSVFKVSLEKSLRSKTIL